MALNTALVGWTTVTELMELVALWSIKRYTVTKQPALLGAGMGVYAATGYVLANAIDSAGVGVANGLWNAFSNIAGGAIGLLQGESYTWNQWLGLALGVVSSILLAASPK